MREALKFYRDNWDWYPGDGEQPNAVDVGAPPTFYEAEPNAALKADEGKIAAAALALPPVAGVDMEEPTPRWEGQFDTFEHWVNGATRALTGRPDSNGWIDPKTKVGVPAVCIDAKGRRCTNGKDFMRARDENAFPVRFFWDCVPLTK
jgi:hypothetical protein